MPTGVIVAIAAIAVMALVGVLAAVIAAVTTSSYDKSLQGTPDDD